VSYVTPSEEIIDGLAAKAFSIASIACGFAAIGMTVAKRRDAQDKSKAAAGSAQQA
jgi:hypothetical protein